MDTAPKDYGPEFLAWLKEATEQAWSEVEDWTIADFRAAGMIGARWRRGTRWSGGLSDSAIAEVQQRYSVRFSPQHRLFLQTLHSTAPWQRGVAYEGSALVDRERPGFYDWPTDDEKIRFSLDSPFSGLLGDTPDGGYWHASWGSRPADPVERRARMVELSPPLVPIFGHRYVVGDSETVLSIVGTDVIVYGQGLHDYLLRELRDVIDVEGTWQQPEQLPEIPFWSHVIAMD